jgi:xanthine phosphoribosyltransferase
MTEKSSMGAGPDKFLSVSWDMFHRDARALACRLAGIGGFSAIVAVTRGGLAPAAIIARELGVRVIETVGVASYREETRQDPITILKPLTSTILQLPGPEVLVIDDLVDTGETARVLRKLLPDAHFAALYAKPQGLPLLDSYVMEVAQDTWIYFPWDTGLAFQAPIRAAIDPAP